MLEPDWPQVMLSPLRTQVLRSLLFLSHESYCTKTCQGSYMPGNPTCRSSMPSCPEMKHESQHVHTPHYSGLARARLRPTWKPPGMDTHACRNLPDTPANTEPRLLTLSSQCYPWPVPCPASLQARLGERLLNT